MHVRVVVCMCMCKCVHVHVPVQLCMSVYAYVFSLHPALGKAQKAARLGGKQGIPSRPEIRPHSRQVFEAARLGLSHRAAVMASDGFLPKFYSVFLPFCVV